MTKKKLEQVNCVNIVNNSDEITFARLCKLAVRPSIDSNAIVFTKPLLIKKPEWVNADVFIDKYEVMMKVHTCPIVIEQTCSSSSSDWQNTSNTDTEYIVDETMYALAQGTSNTSLLLLKRIQNNDTKTNLKYEPVELITNVFKDFVKRMDFETRWKKDKSSLHRL